MLAGCLPGLVLHTAWGNGLHSTLLSHNGPHSGTTKTDISIQPRFFHTENASVCAFTISN
uniref:Uncharacterized protein n=1 Tax=Anguilla anguilla TaxID=7936 RepID=A0A0E9RYK4_ANGAN